MKQKKLMTAVFVALFAGSAQLGHAQSERRPPGIPGYGHGPGFGHGYPGHGPRPGNRFETIAARRAFDSMYFAQNSTQHINFHRAIQDLQNANYHLRQIRRNGFVNSAINRNTSVIRRLDYVLRWGDRRSFWHEANLAIRVIEDAKTDLRRSGLLR
jgi:hypothetical protein